MSDKWKAGPEVQEQINHLIGNAHPHLVDIMDDIVVVLLVVRKMKRLVR
jgi:hypothetical protein